MPNLRDFAPGELLRAEDLNSITDAIRALGGEGTGVSPSRPGGVGIDADTRGLLRLARLFRKWLVPVRIAGVDQPSLPPGEYPFPRDVRYTVRPIWETWAPIVNITPRYNRPAVVDEARIVPAQVGDIAALVRLGNGEGRLTADLFILTERLAIKRCSA